MLGRPTCVMEAPGGVFGNIALTFVSSNTRVRHLSLGHLLVSCGFPHEMSPFSFP